MSFQETLITGRLPRPHPSSPGLYLHAPAVTQASHCANVTSNLPTANGLTMVTLRCGPSEASCPSSLAGDPIRKVPAGTTTISGHWWHSVKLSFGLSPRSSAAVKGLGARAAGCPDAAIGIDTTKTSVPVAKRHMAPRLHSQGVQLTRSERA